MLSIGDYPGGLQKQTAVPVCLNDVPLVGVTGEDYTTPVVCFNDCRFTHDPIVSHFPAMGHMGSVRY
jgi:hypothetical protein